MKFYKLSKYAQFEFKDSPGDTYYSVGVDGMYGRYVAAYKDITKYEKWMYCAPWDEVEIVK